VKAYTTDPGAKGSFIRALRELADYLDQNQAVPVPAYGASIMLPASSAEDGGRAQVDRIAALLGTPVYDDTARGGHYWAVRAFGPIGYEIVAITEAYSAASDALMSYRGSVTPDPEPGPAPGPDA
jgi:hypothetical protein